MTLDNLSDQDLIIINNMMNEFCSGLPGIDFQLLFFCNKDILLNILQKVNYVLPGYNQLDEESEPSDFSSDLLHEKWWAFDPRHIFNLNQNEIDIIVIALDEILKYFDADLNIRIGGNIDEIKKLRSKLIALMSIKIYMPLQWSEFKYYRYLYDYTSVENLRFLIYFFSTDYTPYNDYRIYDKGIFSRAISYIDTTFIYNDLINKMLYIGLAEWNFDETMSAPDLEKFPNYLNQSNNCKISYENFIELTDKILKMKEKPAPFAVIFSDNSDWIRCKGFSFQEELILFPENY